jgi:hypothetical protein
MTTDTQDQSQSTELARKDEPTNGAVATAAAPDETQLTPFYGGAEQIGPEDLQLPQVRVGQPPSDAVQEGIVPAGAVYLGHGAKDPEPKVVYKPGAKGVILHVIGHRKIWAFRSDEDRFTVVDRSPEARVGPVVGAAPGYELAVVVPVYAQDMPCSWLLKGSAMSAGKRIFTETAKAQTPLWALAWSLTTVPRQNEKGRWYAPVVTPAKPRAEYVKAAVAAAELLGAPSGDA